MKQFLIPTKIAIFFILLSSLCSCHNSSTFVKEYAERITEKCPIVLNEAMTITGATYDEDQLTYKILLDENIVNLDVIKTDDYKMLAAISMGNKGMFSNELIDNDVSVVYSFNGNKTGTKHNLIVTPDEMKKMSVENIDISKMYNIILTSSVNVANKSLPNEIEKGIKLEKIELNDTSLVYIYKMSEQMYDISKMDAFSLKKDQEETIRYSDDRTTIAQIRLLVNTNRSLVYKYVGNHTNKECKLVFTRNELMRIRIRN